ncbi:hypothetical protein Patl1_05947 [Pistacia atlantica]|uniref:Uncharacterized protein n=1 Tax=Pistacia atlantica TaxID=434234 RepID=A0ACC1BSF7_9ROSI|nr:hypothetical protein Patl1_05947 [Pistacia atlantica]
MALIRPPFTTCQNQNDNVYKKRLEENVMPLVIALSRNFCVKDGILDLPILNYEDDVISSVVLDRFVGAFVGAMLVEDVEIENECEKREFRRRLRFKRLPNLVQTEVRIVPETELSLDLIKIGGRVRFRPDIGVLVHVYLVPMVASCTLIGSYLGERIQSGFRPKALCVGVGGGALVSFLRTQLCFEVVGVEKDEEVLSVARRYFGLEDGEYVWFHVGDAIEFIEKLACGVNDGDLDTKFDVIMVDLDSGDAKSGISAPPLEFVTRNVLLAARLVLSDFGIFVINVIPPNRSFYETLIREFREVFSELYEIDVGNRENFILIATVLPIVSSASDCENPFLKKLRLVISGAYMDSINKI